MHKRILAAGFAALLAVSGLTTLSGSPVAATTATPFGLSHLLQSGASSARGIATFASVPSAGQVASLRALGLQAQGLEHLPLAIVQGPVAAMATAVSTGIAQDVYPDEKGHYFDMTSADAMGAAAVRAEGFDGEGVTVAVVDSGCDASHPDLGDHVAHNVLIVGPEYANLPPDTPPGSLEIPVEIGPYQNSDLGSGHGTHVAGIIAADGTTDPTHIGVAPGASLVCFAIGEVVFTTAVVSAYDSILDHPDWGIDVVNNSWGNDYAEFDPANPVHVATKAVTDQGVSVVFAAGNSGEGDTEMTLNPWSSAPWVISVAAESVEHERASFSSNGLLFDNSVPGPIPADGHSSFAGNRIGLYHPDVAAPGLDISSSCDTAGTVVGPCPPGENTTASGTSMASPHVAGAAAVLLEANPNLTPEQVRQALQATAVPLDGTPPFWEVGYGRVDLAAAVALVRQPNPGRAIANAQRTADRRVLGTATAPWRVATSDFWTWAPPALSVGGVPDTRSFQVTVPSTTKALKAAISYPSGAAIGINGLEYTVTVKDAGGAVIGVSEPSFWAGTSTVFVDFTQAATPPAFGTWTIDVSGDRSVSDPDSLDSDSLLGDTVTVAVAQLTLRR